MNSCRARKGLKEYDRSGVPQRQFFAVGILSIRDALIANKSRLVVVAVPYEPQLRHDLLELDSEFTTKPQRILADIWRELEIPLLDCTRCLLHIATRTYSPMGFTSQESGINSSC